MDEAIKFNTLIAPGGVSHTKKIDQSIFDGEPYVLIFDFYVSFGSPFYPAFIEHFKSFATGGLKCPKITPYDENYLFFAVFCLNIQLKDFKTN